MFRAYWQGGHQLAENTRISGLPDSFRHSSGSAAIPGSRPGALRYVTQPIPAAVPQFLRSAESFGFSMPRPSPSPGGRVAFSPPADTGPAAIAMRAAVITLKRQTG